MKNKLLLILLSFVLCLSLAPCGESDPPESSSGEVTTPTEPTSNESTPASSEPEGLPPEEKSEAEILEEMRSLYTGPQIEDMTYIGSIEKGHAAVIHHEALTDWGIMGKPTKIGEHIFSNYDQVYRIFVYDGETISELSAAYENGLVSDAELTEIHTFWQEFISKV